MFSKKSLKSAKKWVNWGKGVENVDKGGKGENLVIGLLTLIQTDLPSLIETGVVAVVSCKSCKSCKAANERLLQLYN